MSQSHTVHDSSVLFHKALVTTRERLVAHRLYATITDDRTLRLFMRAHVFAVWDFQSLLTALQREVTCVSIPWMPTQDPIARRLVNEIVLDEESDVTPDGRHLSHFELYLEAMRECGADTKPIEVFLEAIRASLTAGRSPEVAVQRALRLAIIPSGVRAFVSQTMEVAHSGSAHSIAAAFAFGREEVIPAMFTRLVDSLSANSPSEWSTLRYYLDRHIGHDAEAHGPASEGLLERLCGESHQKWNEAANTAQTALEARLCFWDQVAHTLEV